MAKRKGISPVIATVIIVAVTIAVAIAVAFWMTGIIGLFTGFEQLQITSIWDDNDGIHVSVKNTGTQAASITDILINGKSCLNVLTTCKINGTAPSQRLPISLQTGESKTFTITAGRTDATLDPGVSVEVKLVTAAGKEYPKLLVLQLYDNKD
ncbi:MAG: hypothetical protein N3E41_05765 [Thermofilaceae archaeon]|nr:hypothetical protein [Thermofilaceae archaeon]